MTGPTLFKHFSNGVKFVRECGCGSAGAESARPTKGLRGQEFEISLVSSGSDLRSPDALYCGRPISWLC